MTTFKKIITLRTIGSKLILVAVVGLLVFSTITQIVVANTIKDSTITNVKEKEIGDLSYMEDYLGEGSWHVIDNTLYKGDTKIGDGTIENANVEPFEYLEGETGSFFYTFLHVGSVSSGLLQSTASEKDSDYLRVAGSTKKSNGDSIVGTYIDPSVSNELNSTGEYFDYANVEGSIYYCLYRKIVSETNENEIIGAIVVGRSIGELNSKIVKANTRIVVFIASAFFLMVFGLSIIIVRWIRGIKRSQHYLNRIGRGELPSEPLEIKTRDEMEEMAMIINEMNSSLKEKDRMKTELYLAKDIQMSMLPKVFPPFPEQNYFDIYANMEPAREVGGDFYDFFMLDDKNVVVVIADVSGKGIPAALFMSIAKIIIKNNMISGYSVGECFSRTNNVFSENNEAGLFITSWLGLFNVETGILTYVNAGHNPPLISHKNGTFEFLKSTPGFVLGGLEGIKYRQNEVKLNVGDKLFLYTDGVTEAHNTSNNLYGEKRLKEYLDAHINDSINNLISGLRTDIKKYAGDALQSDDITMLVLEYMRQKATFGETQIFPADREALYPCTDFVNAKLIDAGCSIKIQNQIDLVIEEIFVNIVDHGYQSMKGEIEITIDITEDIATIIFKDRGVPFNPLLKETPNLSLSSDERSIGGLGIYLSKQLMDSLEYDFSNGQNILTVRKKIK